MFFGFDQSTEITRLEAPPAEEYRRQNRKYNQLIEDPGELPDSGQACERETFRMQFGCCLEPQAPEEHHVQSM